jgi:hypothetical protein
VKEWSQIKHTNWRRDNGLTATCLLEQDNEGYRISITPSPDSSPCLFRATRQHYGEDEVDVGRVNPLATPVAADADARLQRIVSRPFFDLIEPINSARDAQNGLIKKGAGRRWADWLAPHLPNFRTLRPACDIGTLLVHPYAHKRSHPYIEAEWRRAFCSPNFHRVPQIAIKKTAAVTSRSRADCGIRSAQTPQAKPKPYGFPFSYFGQFSRK